VSHDLAAGIRNIGQHATGLKEDVIDDDRFGVNGNVVVLHLNAAGDLHAFGIEVAGSVAFG
jgi:hypothetical protein